MICHKCNKKLTTSEKISFREDCPSCGADLHVCLNCDFYDTSVYNECRETSAERVVDKEKANLCEYFVVRSSNQNTTSVPSDAKKKLEELFKK